jgi:hypothetical protein
MDPLSAAASVLSVLSAAGATAKLLERLYALKDAPRDLRVVMNEVSYHPHAEASLIISRLLAYELFSRESEKHSAPYKPQPMKRHKI